MPDETPTPDETATPDAGAAEDDADAPAADAPVADAPAPLSPRQEELLSRLRDGLGDAIIDSTGVFNDVVARVRPEAWRRTAEFVRDELGFEVHDCGTHSGDAVDYPDFAAAVAREVASGRCAQGIVIDAAGIGSTMAANKIDGVRCALCHNDATALNARLHNDANLMALGATIVNRGLAQRLTRLFLTTKFEGGRHERRVLKIMALEGGRSPARE